MAKFGYVWRIYDNGSIIMYSVNEVYGTPEESNSAMMEAFEKFKKQPPYNSSHKYHLEVTTLDID